jgi:hypothetical protein
VDVEDRRQRRALATFAAARTQIEVGVKPARAVTTNRPAMKT